MKSSFTIEQQNKIIDILNLGGTHEMAAHALACHPREIRRAMEQDESFAKRVASAELDAEVENLRRLDQAAKTDTKHWRASIWLLERMFPERYARGRRVLLSPRHKTELVQAVVDAVLREFPEASSSTSVRNRLKQVANEKLDDLQGES